MIKYYKFGFGRASDRVNEAIRAGEITREEVPISLPPNAYHLIHSEATYSINKNWEIRLEVENIFNVDYRNYLNRLRYFAGETGRNIRLEVSYTF